VRAETTRATRRRILDTAKEQFVAKGYVGTTLDAVAGAAGVSPQTVYNVVGGKAKLLKAVYDVTLVGDDEPEPLRARSEFAAMLAEPDPRIKLERYAAISRMLWDRVGPLLDVLMQGAQAGEPDLVAFVATVRRESLAGASGVVGNLADVGALRAGLEVERARDELWLLIQPEQYRLLVAERGWSPDAMEDWLARAAIAALLAPA